MTNNLFLIYFIIKVHYVIFKEVLIKMNLNNNFI